MSKKKILCLSVYRERCPTNNSYFHCDRHTITGHGDLCSCIHSIILHLVFCLLTRLIENKILDNVVNSSDSILKMDKASPTFSPGALIVHLVKCLFGRVSFCYNVKSRRTQLHNYQLSPQFQCLLLFIVENVSLHSLYFFLLFKI